MCHDGAGSPPFPDEGWRDRGERRWLLVALALCAVTILAGAGVAAQTGPDASLTYSPAFPDPGENVTLDASDSTAPDGQTIVECAFDVDGDGTVEARTESCRYTHAYADAGEYTATVTVTTSADESARATRNVSVQPNEAPTATIDVTPTAPTVGEAVVLSAANASDRDGSIVTYRWTVDGTQYRGETVTIEAGAAGTREVRLLVTDDDGAEAEAVTTIDVVENEPPEPALAIRPTTPTVGETVTLDASASIDPDGDVVEYRWDLDGDGTVDRTTGTPETTLAVDAAGNRTVSVTVVDDRDATATATVTVTVVAAATATPTPTAPQTATPAGSGGLPFVGGLDLGIVPWVADWVVIVVLVVVAVAIGVWRREAVRSKASEYRRKVKTGEFRKSMAKKGAGFVAKSLVKKLLRAWADVIEFVTAKVGDLFEAIGKAIKRGGKWVANALRSLAG